MLVYSTTMPEGGCSRAVELLCYCNPCTHRFCAAVLSHHRFQKGPEVGLLRSRASAARATPSVAQLLCMACLRACVLNREKQRGRAADSATSPTSV